jgi:hypothetical protein
METITFIYKSKVEQFKEQFPSLYAEIYQLGYMEATTASMYNDEPNDDYDNNPFQDYPEYAVPADDSKRFCYFGSWDSVRNKAIELEHQGYIAGNADWHGFMDGYKHWNEKIMYIAWNPTHKQFAVESDSGVINEYYEHLVGAEEENN